MFVGFHARITEAFFFVLLLAILAMPTAAAGPGGELPVPPLLESEITEDGIRRFLLTADEGSMEFIAGHTTPTLGYNGSYLGPTIRVRRGEDVSIRVDNALAEPTTVHWHGADVPAEADGGPHQVIPSGQSWTADFRVRQPAATLWYHPHFKGTTAKQVYEGLAGMLIIDDAISDTLPLPRNYGVDDLPIILQDRRFDRSGGFSYRPRMPDIMHGYFGNAMLVNGALEPRKDVPAGPVRLRLMNGSNSTFLRLSFGGLESFHVIATDGGFLEAPVEMERLILSPGERCEVIIDLTGASGPVTLLTETNGGDAFEAVTFQPSDPAAAVWNPKDALVTVDTIHESESAKTRRFEMRSAMGARMTINGRTMSMDRVDQRIRLGDTEIWEIVNRDGGGMGMMMNQPHNFHLHAVQFRILDINGEAPPAHMDGWKDTVQVWPGDTVRIIARFDSYPGLYMFHCHLLEHEDNGMMGQFAVVE